MEEFAALRAKTFNSYLGEGKKGKGTKKCVIKRKLKFKYYKNCLEITRLENEINQLEKIKVDEESL